MALRSASRARQIEAQALSKLRQRHQRRLLEEDE
jgi:DNA-directed RNA polymerase sigma subunit (sigma70/sigma32)